MKKPFSIALSLLFALTLCGCGIVRLPEEGTGDEPAAPAPGHTSEGELFTATLTYNGVPYALSGGKATARWTDGTNIYTAPFSNSGTAGVSGLDGDYHVTVSGLPSGFTYNPNVHTATNDNKNVFIPLYRLSSYLGTGADKYGNIITLPGSDAPGYYRFTLTNARQVIYFQYYPTNLKGGEYCITSLVDVYENTVNPILEYYGANSMFKPNVPYNTVNGGGAEGSYTKNFLFPITQYSDSVGGGAVFAFGLRAESLKEDAFPVNIDLVISRDGDATRPEVKYEVVVPKEQFKPAPDNIGKTWHGVAYYNNRRLDSRLFALNPADGYYHVYDSATKTYGEVLFAKLGSSISGILTAATGFLDGQVTLRMNGKDYTDFIRSGYAPYLNRDGCYPVTEELKTFLQEYAISEALFADGNGFAEVNANISAAEEDMWLFACGYYS